MGQPQRLRGLHGRRLRADQRARAPARLCGHGGRDAKPRPPSVLFHAGSTVVFGDWSPGTLTALILFLPLWVHITRLAMREDLLSREGAVAGVAMGGAVHALAVAQQVFRVLP